MVTEKLYRVLKDSENWEEKMHINKNISLSNNIFEIFKSWNFKNYHPSINKLIKNSIYIEDIPFVNIQEVLKWKRIRSLNKDKIDVKLIMEYLG